jgi:hypothetical protein
MNDIINGLIIDLEIDVACLLDSIDEITTKDIEKLQDKLTGLRAEYIERATK